LPTFQENGIVVSVSGETATVRIRPQGGCPESHAGCPARALAEAGEFEAEAQNLVHAGPGDRVVVEMESPHYYKALFLAFGLPVVAIIVGYAAGAALGRVARFVGEGAGFLGAALGFGASFVVMRFAGRNCAPRYTVIGRASGATAEHGDSWHA
jgi:positive regulator of sigma E activity